jgi:hypothetical protein
LFSLKGIIITGFVEACSFGTNVLGSQFIIMILH